MTHELPNGIRVMGVEVSDFAHRFYIKGNNLVFLDRIKKQRARQTIKILPPGSWEILGRFEEVTEDQWNGIVESVVDDDTTGMDYYKVYNHPDDSLYVITATESARSLLGPGNMVVLIDNSKNVRV